MVKRLGFSSLKDYFNQDTLNKNDKDKEDFMENYITDMLGPI